MNPEVGANRENNYERLISSLLALCESKPPAYKPEITVNSLELCLSFFYNGSNSNNLSPEKILKNRFIQKAYCSFLKGRKFFKDYEE